MIPLSLREIAAVVGGMVEGDGAVTVTAHGRTRALTGLDLAVPAGTIYGLLGPNGAGKTTAVRIFATLLRPDGGRARVLGRDVVLQAAQVRRGIRLTGQYAALDESLTGWANLVMIGQLSRLTAKAARWRADQMLARFCWSAAMLAVFAPLAVHLYRRKALS
jgi:ABC-2 type transport system ATP-binding protein